MSASVHHLQPNLYIATRRAEVAAHAHGQREYARGWAECAQYEATRRHLSAGVYAIGGMVAGMALTVWMAGWLS